MPVGNDVVDLRDLDASLQAVHPRFVQRVCNARETRHVRAASDPARMLWALWAAKEAAFKALVKLDSNARFSPQHFAVRLSRGQDGAIRYGSVSAYGYRLAVEIHDGLEYVHAIAHITEANRTPLPCFWQIRTGIRRFEASRVPTEISAAGRNALLEAVAVHLGCATIALRFVESNRRDWPPVLLRSGKPLPVHLSLSHHGRFVAFAFAIAPDRQHNGA